MSDSNPSAPPTGPQSSPVPPPASPAEQPRPDPTSFSKRNISHPQPQLPASPPLSTSASQFDPAAAPSPQAFTPVSAPMSAVQSQQGSTVAEGEDMAKDAALEPRPQKHRLSDDESSSESNKRRRMTPMSEHPSAEHPSDPAAKAETTAEPSFASGHRPAKHKLAEEDDETTNEPSKRRRTDHDREEETVEADRNANADEFAPLYKLGFNSLSLSRPHPSQNLLSLYGLDDISTSVARRDPRTGEKINKLRKSYEGKVKDLSGKNKSVPRPDELMDLLRYPDEEWQIQQVQGNELTGDVSDSLQAKLDKAVMMEAGKLPDNENDRWRNILGLDDPTAKTTAAPVAVQPKAEPAPAKSRTSSSGAAQAISERPRPSRSGTKRRYNDDSFEGYGEGYVDDAGEHVSFDDDEDELAGDTTGKKKKRRVGRPRKSSASSDSNRKR